MPKDIDWEQTTFEGNRRRQHQEFYRLTFLEKLEIIEQSNAIVDLFARAALARQRMQQLSSAEISGENTQDGEIP